MKMFEYKCTSDKVDFEKDYDDNLIVEDHIDEEEIALLLELCNRTDFYELIASEPTYYLKLLETSSELAGLLKSYEIFFTRETESDGCKNNLRIRFKIMKEDQFTEVGFFSDADDKATYKEFDFQCKRLLKRPVVKGTIQEISDEDNEPRTNGMIVSQLEDNVMDEIMSSDDIFKDYSKSFKVNDNNGLRNEEVKHKHMGILEGLEALENLRACCPKEYLNDYDKMLLTLKYNKKSLKVPSKKLYEGLLEVYKNTDDDAVKYEIDNFLFTNNGHLYAKQQLSQDL